jgi:hypothetical protein
MFLISLHINYIDLSAPLSVDLINHTVTVKIINKQYQFVYLSELLLQTTLRLFACTENKSNQIVLQRVFSLPWQLPLR